MLGAERVAVTDLEVNLPLLRRNVMLNKDALACTVEVAALDWLAAIPSELSGPWDVIVAADCVFWEALFEPLLASLVNLVTSKTKIYLSVTHRYDKVKKFISLMPQTLTCTRVWQGESCGTYERVGEQEIYLLQRKCCI